MKIVKEEYAIISVCIEADMKIEGQGMGLMKMLEKLGVAETVIKDAVMETSNESFKIKNVKILGE